MRTILFYLRGTERKRTTRLGYNVHKEIRRYVTKPSIITDELAHSLIEGITRTIPASAPTSEGAKEEIRLFCSVLNKVTDTVTLQNTKVIM